MHQRSTYFTEDEAIAWATQGLVRLKDVLRGTRVQGPSSFRTQFLMLNSSKVHDVSMQLPEEWGVALQDGTARTWGDALLPSDLSQTMRVRLSCPSSRSTASDMLAP